MLVQQVERESQELMARALEEVSLLVYGSVFYLEIFDK